MKVNSIASKYTIKAIYNLVYGNKPSLKSLRQFDLSLNLLPSHLDFKLSLCK